MKTVLDSNEADILQSTVTAIAGSLRALPGAGQLLRKVMMQRKRVGKTCFKGFDDSSCRPGETSKRALGVDDCFHGIERVSFFYPYYTAYAMFYMELNPLVLKQET